MGDRDLKTANAATHTTTTECCCFLSNVENEIIFLGGLPCLV